jgi:serine/threonine protein kinase
VTRSASPDRLPPGARIGDYAVEREVACEPTVVVYLATHVVLPRRAQLHVTQPGSQDAAVQLLREACILEALSHPGIPRVFECGVLPDRRPWSAIEHLTGAIDHPAGPGDVVGVTLDRYVGHGPLGIADLVVAVRDVADILRHAHDRGVVHRHLTGATIVRTPRRRGHYAVCAWDQARTLDAGGELAVDPRDDVYALGQIAFRALSGSSPEPVPADERPAHPARPVRPGTEPFVPVRSAALGSPAAPSELVGLLDQMLAEPAARPSSQEVYDRAVWLCDALDLVPQLDRPRWTPPLGIVKDRAELDDSGGFSIRITR